MACYVSTVSSENPGSACASPLPGFVFALQQIMLRASCVLGRVGCIMVSLPLWTVTEHIQPSDPEKLSGGKVTKALAFSSSAKLFEFVAANTGGEWKMQMAADREGLIILIADLHRLEIESLSLDPKKDGTGGEPVSLVDLAKFASSDQ
jgi:hypothetical protein